MTSMQKVTGKELPFQEVKARVAREYAGAAGLTLTHQHLMTSN